MYDFVKMVTNGEEYANRIKQLGRIWQPINPFTAEVVDNIFIVEDEAFTIKIYESNRIEIFGSLHKFQNGGEHNQNDFTLFDVRKAIDEFELRYLIPSSEITVHGLEYGMNVIPHIPVKDLLRRLISYKNKTFNEMKLRKRIGKGYEIRASAYELSLYDKGCSPCLLGYPYLRFEKKICAMAKLGFKHPLLLQDLKSKELFEYCLKDLIAEFQHIRFLEDIDVSSLSNNDRLFFIEAQYGNFWARLSKQLRHLNNKRFESMISLYATSDHKKNLEEIFRQKANNLITDI